MDNTAVFYTVNMGSIPVGRTNMLGISQVGKATDFDSVMHRFDPCIPYQIWQSFKKML